MRGKFNVLDPACGRVLLECNSEEAVSEMLVASEAEGKWSSCELVSFRSKGFLSQLRFGPFSCVIWGNDWETDNMEGVNLGLLCFLVSREMSANIDDALHELTDNPSTVIPEQVLLLLHSQLSSDKLVLLQGLQERGLWHLLPCAPIAIWQLEGC